MLNESTDFDLVCYCDADWGGDKVDRKSTAGYIFKLGKSVITLKWKKQQTATLFSTEAEYMALKIAVKEVLWIRQLLDGVGSKGNTASTIYEDNKGCELLSEHSVHRQRTRHINMTPTILKTMKSRINLLILIK